MSNEVISAIQYLRAATLSMEITKKDFGVRDVTDALSTIDARYAKSMIASQSVASVKAWTSAAPDRRGYEAHATTQLAIALRPPPQSMSLTNRHSSLATEVDKSHKRV